MSGHSKWAQIKHKKSIEDKKRGQIFSKIVKLISVAVKEKGASPDTNPTLRIAIEKSKAVNMPSDNIERAIKKAAGEGGVEKLESLILEIYGPGGAAILVEAITDSKNRTISEIKHTLSKYDSRLAEEGSVKWMFSKNGVIRISKDNFGKISDLELKLIDLGANDIKHQEEDIEIYLSPEKTDLFKTNLKEFGIETESILVEWTPTNHLLIQDKQNKEKIEKLLEELDDNEDVSDVYSNIDFG